MLKYFRQYLIMSDSAVSEPILQLRVFQEDRANIGEVFQDERNMAALLLYRHGDDDQYHMVGQYQIRSVQVLR